MKITPSFFCLIIVKINYRRTFVLMIVCTDFTEKRRVFKSLLLVLWVFFIGLVQLSAQQGRPTFDPRTGASSRPVNPQAQDTVSRPPLEYNTFHLQKSIRKPRPSLDTTLYRVHLIEPLYQTPLLRANLGSENSGTMKVNGRVSVGGNVLGHPVFDDLMSTTAEEDIKVVNRSYWSLYYGSGRGVENPIPGSGKATIGSGHLETRFYRSFARNITFNFDYKSYNDDGSMLQTNDFGQLNMKLMQKSNNGRRISYVHYDRPSIEENLNPDQSTSASNFINVSRKRSLLEIGNNLIKLDTSTNSISYEWNSRISFLNNTYKVRSDNLSTEGQNITLSRLAGDSLSMTNELGGLYTNNSIDLSRFGGNLRLETDINLLQFNSGNIISDDLLEIILSGRFEKRVNDKLTYRWLAKIGFGDASNVWEAGGEMSYKIFKNATIDGGVSYKSWLPDRPSRSFVVNNTLIQENDFSNPTGLEVNATYSNPDLKHSVEVFYGDYSKFIVTGTNGLYDQLTNQTRIFRATGSQDIRLGPFYTKHHLSFQYTNADAVQVIPLQYHLNAFFKLSIFRKRMKTHFGVDGYFIPSFTNPGFFPLTGSFFTSNSSSPSGKIIMVNPYLNIQVDRLFVFVKGVNALRQLYPGNASLVNGYPLYNYRFRFGVRWSLLD